MVRNCAPPRMETTFYDEQRFHPGGDVNQLKRSMTLDLNAARQPAKRSRFGPALTVAPVLSTPDLNMCKLATPEIERFIMQQQNAPTTAISQPFQFPQAPVVTEEQELYARGFVDALNELHHSDSSQSGSQANDLPITSTSVSSGGGITYTNLDAQSHGFLSGGYLEGGVMVKEEPQTVPNLSSSPPVSPIDMECQERIKLERKRQRNRVAASKCRRRKLERISRLEDKVKLLKGENSELSSVVLRLKEHVCQLKEQVMEHVHSGCQIITPSQF